MINTLIDVPGFEREGTASHRHNNIQYMEVITAAPKMKRSLQKPKKTKKTKPSNSI